MFCIGLRTETGIEAQLLRQLVGNTGTAAQQQHVVADTFRFAQLYHVGEVLDVNVLLGYGLGHQQHIRMDFLMTLLPKSVGSLLTRLVYLIAAGFCGALIVYSWQLVEFTIEMEQTSPAMGVPMWIPYLAMPLGSALMVLHFVIAAFAKEAN